MAEDDCTYSILEFLQVGVGRDKGMGVSSLDGNSKHLACQNVAGAVKSWTNRRKQVG